MAIVKEQEDIGELIGTLCHRFNLGKVVACRIVTDMLDLARKNPDLPVRIGKYFQPAGPVYLSVGCISV